MKKLFGFQLSSLGIFIGIVYLIESLFASAFFIRELSKFVDRRNSVHLLAVTDADREISSIYCTCLAFAITYIFASLLLIWGTLKKNPLMLYLWLFTSCVVLIIIGLVLFVVLFQLGYTVLTLDKTRYSRTHSFLLFVMSLLFALKYGFYKIVKDLQNEIYKERERLLIIESQWETSSAIYVISEEDILPKSLNKIAVY